MNFYQANLGEAEKYSLNDIYLKYLNKVKPVVIDFDNDDWISDPNLCEIQTFEIDKMSYYSDRSDSCTLSADQSVNLTENLSDTHDDHTSSYEDKSLNENKEDEKENK